MPRLTPFSRRRFGQGLGASLALACSAETVAAGDPVRTVEVRISGFAFVPQHVEIDAGDTVLWVNDDIAPHTATARDGGWETATLETAGKARQSFETPGTYEYVCAFHPHMTGILSVRARTFG